MAEAITPSNNRPPTNFRQQAVRAQQNQDARRAQQRAPVDADDVARSRAANDRDADDRAAQAAAVRRAESQRANDRVRQDQPRPGQVLDTFA